MTFVLDPLAITTVLTDRVRDYYPFRLHKKNKGSQIIRGDESHAHKFYCHSYYFARQALSFAEIAKDISMNVFKMDSDVYVSADDELHQIYNKSVVFPSTQALLRLSVAFTTSYAQNRSS